MFTADIPLWLIVAVVFIAWYVIKTMGKISIGEARRHLKEGAVILDVRTQDEFTGAHLDEAINLPLADLPGGIGAKIPDRETVVLCYCLSGVRSGSAVAQLKKSGYAAYNLGSLGRARKLEAM